MGWPALAMMTHCPMGGLRFACADLQQEGEAGVSVGDVTMAAVLSLHQLVDDQAQRAQALVDAAGLLQALAHCT